MQQIVEIARAVPLGTAPTAVPTVPAGLRLVVTDAMLTNTDTTATCGVAITRAGRTADPTTLTSPPATRCRS